MSISIESITKLLAKKKLTPQKYFELYGRCAFIEVLNEKNGDVYMFYIPSRYEFSIHNKDTYKINPYDISDKDLDNYTGNYNYSNVNNMYDNIEIDVDADNDDQIYDKVVNNYRTTIDFNNKKDIEYEDIVSLMRQMMRFKYCVQNIKYKFIILYKNYMCVLHIGDHIECFTIKNYHQTKKRKLIILIDLELYYKHMDTLEQDISQLNEGIQNILDKNHMSHTRQIKKIVSTKFEIDDIISELIDKKTNIREYIISYKELLEKLLDSEKEIIDEYVILKDKFDTSTLSGDINMSKQKSTTEKKLKKIEKLKFQIISNIKKLKEDEVNLSLISDIILFDNTVMLNKIFKNIKHLIKFSKND